MPVALHRVPVLIRQHHVLPSVVRIDLKPHRLLEHRLLRQPQRAVLRAVLVLVQLVDVRGEPRVLLVVFLVPHGLLRADDVQLMLQRRPLHVEFVHAHVPAELPQHRHGELHCVRRLPADGQHELQPPVHPHVRHLRQRDGLLLRCSVRVAERAVYDAV